MAPNAASTSVALAGSTADLALMRRVAVAMFVVGALTSLSGVWVTQQTDAGRFTQGVVTVLLVASAAVLGAVRSLRLWMIQAAVLWGIGILGWLMAGSEPIGVGSFFYLWPVVFAAYFCATRFVWIAYGGMVLSMAVGLAANELHKLKLDTFVGTASTVGLMAGLVTMMTSQEARLRRELALAAETDPLTGLLNRRSFNPSLDGLVARALADGRRLSVVMIDLDHFKRLNDEFGHTTGDRALEEVGAVLQAASRDGDLVSRFGGEEFAVALPGAGADDAEAYAERVAAEILGRGGAPGVTLSASAGICELDGPGTTTEALLQHADAALYAAKAAGRDRPARWTERGIDLGLPFADRRTATSVRPA